jgi:hypothetical protein
MEVYSWENHRTKSCMMDMCIYITGIVLDNTKFGMNKNGGLINRNCGIMGQHFFLWDITPNVSRKSGHKVVRFQVGSASTER